MPDNILVFYGSYRSDRMGIRLADFIVKGHLLEVRDRRSTYRIIFQHQLFDIPHQAEFEKSPVEYRVVKVGSRLLDVQDI